MDSPEPVKIRAPRPGDAARLAALSTELGYPAAADAIAGRLARLVARGDHCLRVAELPAVGVIGWIQAEERHVLEAGSWCEIVGLVVDSGHRGRGAGRALVGEIEAWARARGLRAVKVRSNVTRAESHPFYQRLGYARAKTQHVYVKSVRPAPQNTTPG